MVKIKLKRTGKKHQPIYRIIAIDSRKKRDGQELEVIGFYNPTLNPAQINLKKDRYLDWIKKGAQPTKTVADLAKIALKK
jgi:small subunit ribosomal protein S16